MDIKTLLGTLSVQLEIDDRTLRYLGHLCRLPSDRWESKILKGIIGRENEHGGFTFSDSNKVIGQDLWWSRVQRLVKEIMKEAPRDEPWYELATDRKAWRKMKYEWKQKRISQERQDTHKGRESKWEAVAERCMSPEMVQLCWGKLKPPNADGTSLATLHPDLQKHLILAGGLCNGKWSVHAPQKWQDMCDTPTAKAWLEYQGTRIRRRVQNMSLSSLTAVASRASCPAYTHCKRMRGKQTVPARNPLSGPPPNKRLRIKQSVPSRPNPARPMAAPVAPLTSAVASRQNEDKVKCEDCGEFFKKISMPGHKRLYCPYRQTANLHATRGDRKVVRPVPPVTAKAASPAILSPEEASRIARLPSIHPRWTPVLPHAKGCSMSLNPSSIPAPPAAHPEERPRKKPRPSQKPANPSYQIINGCFGACRLCNSCDNCRSSMCNGNCGKCRMCKCCRDFGKLLSENNAQAISIFNQAKSRPAANVLPPLTKEQIRQRDQAKAAMPKGARSIGMCPYCQKFLPHNHRENCPSMPYDVWIAATRARQLSAHGADTVNSWRVQCQHCTLPFPSIFSKRVHLAGCERRRNSCDPPLPLNQYPAIRNPP